MAPLRISVPTTHTDSSSGKDFTAYEIRIEHPFPRATTTLQKRYSDFANLDSALRAEAGSAPPSSLPAKSWLGGGLSKLGLGLGSTAGSPELVEKRRQGLEQYLRAIETNDDGKYRVCKAYKDFLDLGDWDKKVASFPGSQFGKDRVRDSTDWLDKYSDVKSNLQDARKWLTKREQATAATAQHEAGANAKKGLVRAASLLSALEEGLSRLGGSARSGDDWSVEKLGDGEIRRRRDLISTSRKERDGLESVLNTMAVKAAVSGSGASAPSMSSAAVSNEQKAALFTRANQPTSGRRVLGAPVQETDRTRELDNHGVLQLQQQIVAEQDQDLVDLTTVVQRMKEMGVQINQEIVEQNAMLGLFGDDVQRVDGKMKVARKRMDKIK
jgi:regulator of vacuolar morphogenesis